MHRTSSWNCWKLSDDRKIYGPFRGWVDAPHIRPQGWSDPKFPFDAVNAVWAVYVSFEGQPARLIQSLALYQNRFAVLHLKSWRGRELDAEFKFYDSDPRTIKSP